MAGQKKDSPRTPLHPEERQLPTTAGCEGPQSCAEAESRFLRWAAETAEEAMAQARASATAAAGEEAPNGLSGANVIPSAVTCSHIQSYSISNSGNGFCARRDNFARPRWTSPRDAEGYNMAARCAMCPTPLSSRLMLWQLPRQTLPDVQNFLSFTICSALSSACRFRQY